MARNIVLFASTLALLGILFVGYWILVDDPIDEQREGRAAIDSLPADSPEHADAAIRVAGQVEVPPGQGPGFTVYDERTGQATQDFRCAEWTPVRGAKNQVRVTQPELTLRLPSGMIATIRADSGELTVDRIEKVQGRPKFGWLRDNVRIVIDRDTSPDRTPAEDRPEDLITIALDRLDFDLELGQLHTDGSLSISSADFDISGTGLDLVWNQADNVVESLWLHRGEQLTLYGNAGLFRTRPDASPETAVADQPGATAGAPHRLRKPARKAAAYSCKLTEQVVAEQLEGDRVLGRLTADEVALLFDAGGATGRFMYKTATAPTSRPTPDRRERLVVRWTGPLRLEPAPPAAHAEQPRRHFEARGKPVTLTHADGVVRCGRLEYYDETQQIWLHPADDGRVDFALGQNLSAAADSVYIDQASNLVKLIGDVSLASQRGSQPGRRKQTLRCSMWAELHLAAPPSSTAAGATRRSRDELLSYGQLRAATFVGDARVELGGQMLTAHRIDATFKPAAQDQPLDATLDTATALGSVKLGRRDESLECEQLKLIFAVTDTGELYPRQMDARGSVRIVRGRSWVRGEHVRAELEPAPPDRAPDDPAFVLRTLDITGDAELRDPRNEVAARAHRILAAFTGVNRLSRAAVYGTAERFGLVHASPYTVGGEQIDLEWETQTLHVDGRAGLSFKSKRGLQGQRRRRPTRVRVNCDESLHIDGLRNTIHFAGNVVAKSGGEALRAKTLTLLLEDVEEPGGAEADLPRVGELLQEARQLFANAPAGDRPGELLELPTSDRGRIRKEPVRLVAEDALVQSESYEPGDEQPLVYSDIAAPVLEVDIVNREIMTRGRTTLLLTSRRLDSGQPEQREVFGLPSALITRGPTQTAMQCEGSMTYALGPEGPRRRDSVLFEGGVVLAHRAGREIVNIEQWLPQLRDNPELLNDYQSRNSTLQCDRLECGFLIEGAGDAGEPAPVAGRTALRLTWLLASGRTQLVDIQRPVTRTVFAQQIDFDRTVGLLRVLGTSETHARIYEENRQTQDANTLVGQEFIVDLHANTIRSGPTRGEIRQDSR